MKKFRVTFTPRDGGVGIHFDIEAATSAEAEHEAYARCKRMYNGGPEYIFSDMMTEEIVKGEQNIGIQFKYYDTMLKRDFTNYMVIHALSEEQAVEYYNASYKGKRFYQPWPHKIDDNGNCTYGVVVDTYFAACPGYDADATA